MNPTLPVIVLGAALTLLSAVQAWLLWRLSRMVAASARLEEKVGHLGDALSILTETSEAGFKAIADELTRRAVAPAPRPDRRRRSRASGRRPARARASPTSPPPSTCRKAKCGCASISPSTRRRRGRAPRPRKERADALRA